MPNRTGAKPHRAVITAGKKLDQEQSQIDALSGALKRRLKQELTSEIPNATTKTE